MEGVYETSLFRVHITGPKHSCIRLTSWNHTYLFPKIRFGKSLSMGI